MVVASKNPGKHSRLNIGFTLSSTWMPDVTGVVDGLRFRAVMKSLSVGRNGLPSSPPLRKGEPRGGTSGGVGGVAGGKVLLGPWLGVPFTVSVTYAESELMTVTTYCESVGSIERLLKLSTTDRVPSD